MAERAFVNLCRLSLEHSEGKVIPFLCIAKGPKGIKAVAQLLPKKKNRGAKHFPVSRGRSVKPFLA
jgi:hypothetical protein